MAEQTSGPKPGATEFLAWWDATANPDWTPDDAGFSHGLSEMDKRLIVAGNQLMACKGFLAAWDARQPEIDRLRAALERINFHLHRVEYLPDPLMTGQLKGVYDSNKPHAENCPACIAEEALDG